MPMPTDATESSSLGSSTPKRSFFGAKGSRLSRAEFEDLGPEELLKYLATQKVVMPEDVQRIFRTQLINGDGLLGMTKVDLVACGVPIGVAAQS